MELLQLTWLLTQGVWRHQQISARRKLQEIGAAVTYLVIDIEIDGAANRKILEESCKKMALL
jgi:hypothetical protein